MLKKFKIKDRIIGVKNRKNNGENNEKILRKKDRKSKFKVRCCCYQSGRILQLLKKADGKIANFSCEKGEITFLCKGVFRGEIEQIIKKCGGENCEICDVGMCETLVKTLPIVLGIFLFCTVIFLSNLFVFSVKISGEDDVLKVHIQNIAEEIFPFASVKTDEKYALLKSELSKMDDVAYYTIESYQNTIFINFLEGNNAEIIVGETNIVAPENGRIISLSTLFGTAKKQVGDEVYKGEILIASETHGENPESLDFALGSGVLQVEKTSTYTFPIIAEEKTYTGEIETVQYIVAGDREYFNFQSEFINYDVQNKTVKFLAPNIMLARETRIEYKSAVVVYLQSELEEMARRVFESSYLENFAHTIIDIETTSEIVGEECKVTVKCKYLLQFGR